MNGRLEKSEKLIVNNSKDLHLCGAKKILVMSEPIKCKGEGSR